MAKNKKQKEQEAPKRLNIQVKTLTNGYALEVNNCGYMYFSVDKLLKGIICHVGLGRMADMTEEEMDQIIKALQDGSAERQLQEEVTALKAQIAELKDVIKEQKKEIENLK